MCDGFKTDILDTLTNKCKMNLQENQGVWMKFQNSNKTLSKNPTIDIGAALKVIEKLELSKYLDNKSHRSLVKNQKITKISRITKK